MPKTILELPKKKNKDTGVVSVLKNIASDTKLHKLGIRSTLAKSKKKGYKVQFEANFTGSPKGKTPSYTRDTTLHDTGRGNSRTYPGAKKHPYFGFKIKF